MQLEQVSSLLFSKYIMYNPLHHIGQTCLVFYMYKTRFLTDRFSERKPKKRDEVMNGLHGRRKSIERQIYAFICSHILQAEG